MALLSCKGCGDHFRHEEQVIVVYESGTSKEPRHGTAHARDAPVAALYHPACYAAAGNVIPPRD